MPIHIRCLFNRPVRVLFESREEDPQALTLVVVRIVAGQYVTNTLLPREAPLQPEFRGADQFARCLFDGRDLRFREVPDPVFVGIDHALGIVFATLVRIGVDEFLAKLLVAVLEVDEQLFLLCLIEHWQQVGHFIVEPDEQRQPESLHGADMLIQHLLCELLPHVLPQ